MWWLIVCVVCLRWRNRWPSSAVTHRNRLPPRVTWAPFTSSKCPLHRRPRPPPRRPITCLRRPPQWRTRIIITIGRHGTVKSPKSIRKCLRGGTRCWRYHFPIRGWGDGTLIRLDRAAFIRRGQATSAVVISDRRSLKQNQLCHWIRIVGDTLQRQKHVYSDHHWISNNTKITFKFS